MASAAITTVIPTFRRPKLLKRAIESVLAQSVLPLKICVYDNASGDETESVVAEYSRRDDRVFYLKNHENIGPIGNFAQGISAVTTDFYSILSDDDFLLPGFYEDALAAFERHPEAGFVCARTIIVNLVTKKWQFRNADWPPGVYERSIGSALKMYRSHFALTGVVLREHMRSLIGTLEKSGDDCLYLTMAAASSSFVVLGGYGAVFTFYPQSYSATTGLRGGDSRIVFDALLSTVETVLRLSLPVEERVHLLLLVMRSYAFSFDMKKLEDFVSDAAESPVKSLRSQTTLIGIFARVCERAPKALRPLLRYYARRLTRGWKHTESGSSRVNLLQMPEEVVTSLLSEESDLSKFLAFAGKSDIGIK